MATAAILPVKRFESAKQRLNGELGAGTRAALASAMFADVLSALDRARSLQAIVVVSGDPRVQDFVTGRDVVLVQDTTDKGQSQAARSGLARASALGCDRAVLVPGDCPLIDSDELDELVEGEAARADVVIVPDRHETGTNLLALSPAGPFEPQFGPDSLRRHTEQAKRRGLSWTVEHVPSLALDVDTTEDLNVLAEAAGRSHGRAPRTQGVLRQIERSRPSPPVAV